MSMDQPSRYELEHLLSEMIEANIKPSKYYDRRVGAVAILSFALGLVDKDFLRRAVGLHD
jgi:hypothetical protein